METRKKLRIGVLVDSYSIPAWCYKMLGQIDNSSSSELVLIVKHRSDIVKKGFAKKIFTNRSFLLYNLFNRVDAFLFKSSPNAFEHKDIRSLPCQNATFINSPESDSILEKIRKYNIDVFFKMGFSAGREFLRAAKYGVWSLHHGDSKKNRGGPAGFWEVMKNWPETGVVLQILSENSNNKIILHKSFSRTDSISPSRSRNNYYWKSLSFFPSKIEELYNIGEEKFFEKVEGLNGHPRFYSNELYSMPNNRQMFVLWSTLVAKYIANKLRSLLSFEQWILLYKLNAEDQMSTSFFEFKKILPPKDRFWADPFVLQKDDKYFVFIEELLYARGKGHISVITIDNAGTCLPPVKVLEKNYHLSYPFLIEDNGEIFMVPETAENKTIELYKCIDFPHNWTLEKILMENITALDPTILFHNGKYWLFANVITNKGASSDELFLFFSDTLSSNKWTSHPLNPIVSDVKQSRPAGKPFIFKSKLYRPSQNCSIRYGFGMKINQITELSETKYKEIVVDSILPAWDKKIIATHTLNSTGKLTVIDGLMVRKRSK